MIVPSVAYALALTWSQTVAPVGGQPPSVNPPPGLVAPAPRYEGPRFGVFAGGVSVLGTTNAVAAGALYTLSSGKVGGEPRLLAVLYYVQSRHTDTVGAIAAAQQTYWFGRYGLGAGSGLGFATSKRTPGARENVGQLAAYAAPVQLRFGDRPMLELGLNAGATIFTNGTVRPFGYLYAGVLF